MARKRGIGSHSRPGWGATNEWLTPRAWIDALGPFDLDPCSPIERPWDTASRHYTVLDDGLAQDWEGKVWLNPPYGKEVGKWLARLVDHGDGIALIMARTETRHFFEHIWCVADALLFARGRPTFCVPSGRPGPSNSGAPVVFAAYGDRSVQSLRRSGIEGAFVTEWDWLPDGKLPFLDNVRGLGRSHL